MRKSFLITLLAVLWLVLAASSSSAQSPGIVDNGWMPHAQGPLNGDIYTVIWGDTVFSISRRFNVDQYTLMSYNGIPSPYRLLAGQPIRIPTSGPGPQPCPSPFLTITNPPPNTNVGTSFPVSGSGCGLFEGNVFIRALDSRGVQVGQVVTTLSGPTVGIGGQGTYNDTMTVSGAQGQLLTLLAISNNVEYSRVTVNLNDGGGGIGQCQSSALSIFEPGEGANVPASFTVRGDAAFNCTVTITARDGGGRQLGTANAGTFQGTQWSTTLALQGGIAPWSDIFIEARTNGGGVAQRRVRFDGGQQPSLTITEPAPNTPLQTTFRVRGVGAGLGNTTLIVQAISNNGGLIQEQSVQTDFQGAFDLQMTVNQNTPGRIEVRSQATGAFASVPVTFNGGGSPSNNFRDLPNGQCQLNVPVNGVPAFANPDGPQVRTLSAGWLPTVRVVRFGGQLWYVIPNYSANAADDWVRGGDVQASGSCGL
ncbi:MAG: LysM peptidoglycan-binding domain-containing protein [Caldilineaceae bacterium]|nr:LysM peptidoglycan-binding domain-containing protein [Caldilineaceae bacterium]